MYIDKERQLAILQKFPNTKSIMDIDGTIGSYYSNTLDVIANIVIPDRLCGFFESIKTRMGHLFSSKLIVALINDLKSGKIISSAEHLCSIPHPEVCNTLLGQSVYRQGKSNVLISCAISGQKFTNELDSRFLYLWKDKKMSWLPSSAKNKIMMYEPAMHISELEKKLLLYKKQEAITAEEHKVLAYIQDIFARMPNCAYWWEQISIFNFNLWSDFSMLFGGDLPKNLFMVPTELLIQDALIYDIKHKRNSWVIKILFNKHHRQLVYERFDGIRSCWDTKEQKGTFLFWGVDQKTRPVQLFLENDVLQSHDKTITIDLQEEDIKNALEQGIIFPSSSLVFFYLSFYMGFNVFGGILQIQYLPDMLQGILSLKHELRLTQEDIHVLNAISTDTYVNFERNSISENMLLKIINNEGMDKEYERYIHKSFNEEIQGCLNFLYNIGT